MSGVPGRTRKSIAPEAVDSDAGRLTEATDYALAHDSGIPLGLAEHNGAVTWRHLLHQTSEWKGTLLDKPDLVDRNRDVVTGDNSKKATHCDLQAPGTFYEYNDVRVRTWWPMPRFCSFAVHCPTWRAVPCSASKKRSACRDRLGV